MASNAFPPGEYIRDELESRGWTQEDLADIMGRPLKSVNQIITGAKQVTPQTARELAAAFGTSAELWLNLESAYRLTFAESAPNQVGRRAALYGNAPIREMFRRRWLKITHDIAALERDVTEFFSPEVSAAARKSTSYDTTTPAQKAWMCRAFHLARRLEAKEFSADRARKLLPELHALTVSEQEVRNVPALLSEMGIRFLVVEHLEQTKIDGAALWLGKSPAIAVSLRYDRIDAFWHTLCHELSHVLHGDGWTLDDDLIGADRIGSQNKTEQEQRADEEASNFLVPRAKLESFINRHRPRFSKVNIIRFANLHQIHPGIIVGQLQHRGAIRYSHSREMLVPVRTMVTDVAFTDGWGHFPNAQE